MKLDRNTNPDGEGKYALINLRVLREKPEFRALVEELAENGLVTWGNESPGDQFFVMKYRDQFAVSGLTGYRRAIENTLAVMSEAEPTEEQEAKLDELREFAAQIRHEEILALKAGVKSPD